MTDYFSLPELRALPDLGDSAVYDDATLTRARDWITALVERVCQTSFVAKVTTVTASGSGAATAIRLPDWVLALTSVALGGGDVTARVDWTRSGYLELYETDLSCQAAWTRGLRNVVIVFSAGWSATPPSDLKEAMLVAARHHVISVDGQSGIPSRATSLTNEFGNVALAQADEDKAPTGLPEVDAILLGYKRLTFRPAL